MRQSTLLVGLVLALSGPALAEDASASNSVAKLSNEAKLALEKGQLPRAIEQYTAIIGAPMIPEADKARAELNRGLAYQRQGLHAKAASDYSAALERDALDARTRSIALYNRALAYRKLNQPGLAVKDLTSALFLRDDFAEAYMSRGLVMRESGKHYYALSDFHKAIQSDFKQAHLAYFARAIVFEDLRRQNDAKNELNRALMLKPDFAEAREKLVAMGGELPSTTTANLPQKDEPVAMRQRVASLSSGIVTGSLGSRAELPAKNTLDAKDGRKAVTPPRHLLDDDAPRSSNAKASGKEQPAVATLVATTSDGDKSARHVKLASADPGAAVEAAKRSPVKDQTEKGAAVAAAATGWLIQLSSTKSEDSAWDVWKKLSAKHGKTLADQTAVVIRADLGKKGVYYRLRLAGFDSRQAADKNCATLKKRGLSCFVTRAETE